MALPTELESKSPDALEEWFLGRMESGQKDLAAMIPVLDAIASATDGRRADALAELLQESLADAGERVPLRVLLQWRAQWRGADDDFRTRCLAALRRVFTDRLGAAFVDSAFAAPGAAAEGLRRLGTLMSLQPGCPCLDGAWGFGTVRAVDEFYLRLVVDFERKPGHTMSFAHAAGSLVRLADDHIYVRQRRSPAELQALVRERPAEVVRMALASFGPLDVERLRAVLSAGIVPDAQWKPFWDAARRELKADPGVTLPARRTEPLRLEPKAAGRAGNWCADLERTSDPERILDAVARAAGADGSAAFDETARRVVAGRLGYVAWACEGRRPDLAARALLAASDCGCAGAGADAELARGWDALLRAEEFLAASRRLPIRDAARLLRAMAETRHDGAVRLWLSVLNRMSVPVFGEVAEILLGDASRADLLAALRAHFDRRDGGVEMLLWAARNLGLLRDLDVVATSELLFQAIEALVGSCSGDALRAQNQLRLLLESREWMGDAIEDLDPAQRRMLLARVQASAGLDAASRRAVLGILAVLDPSLRRQVEAAVEEQPSSAEVRYTSWRTYRERQEQLRRLLEEEIPANSRDIARARSYGDLRENSEFKFAKEHQRVLHRRRDEYAADLETVRGTDFTGADTSAAGMGTHVVLRGADGAETRFSLLGEWDRDEALGIVSCRSKTGEVLLGRRPGDTVAVPGDANGRSWTVVAVGALPPEVRAWIGGGSAGGEAVPGRA